MFCQQQKQNKQREEERREGKKRKKKGRGERGGDIPRSSSFTFLSSIIVIDPIPGRTTFLRVSVMTAPVGGRGGRRKVRKRGDLIKR